MNKLVVFSACFYIFGGIFGGIYLIMCANRIKFKMSEVACNFFDDGHLA